MGCYLKKTIKYSSLFQLYICMRPDYVLIQQIECRNKGESSYILLSQSLKRFTEMFFKAIFTDFFILQNSYFHK